MEYRADDLTRAVNPEMIILARESRGLTQTELARRLVVTQSNISKVEAGLIGTSEPMLGRLSEVLGYPSNFFYQTDQVYGPGMSEFFHRKRQSLPEKVLSKLHAQMSIRLMHVRRLLRSAETDPCQIPSIDIDEYGGRVGDIAGMVRAKLGLAPGPVPSVTRYLEDAGAIVVPCDFGTRLLDAIGRWVPGLPPVFFVNEWAPGDRLRFTLSHELAHIVMHSNPNPDMEVQADQFAAAFLLPEKDVKPYLEHVTLPKLATLKPYWKVSMGALLHRAGDLGKVTESQARILWMQMSKAGYRTREPVELEIPQEKPSLLQELISLHLEELKYTVSELSCLLALNEQEFRGIYLGQRGTLRVVG